LSVPGAFWPPEKQGSGQKDRLSYRDPPAVKTTNLSGGIEFTVLP
jgi:hypothetical protein